MHLPFVRLVRRSEDASFTQEAVPSQEDGYRLCLLLLAGLLGCAGRRRDSLEVTANDSTMLNDALAT